MADISSTGVDLSALHAHQRKPSVGAIAFQDAAGHHTTIELDELAEDDRELAEKFGYKPVSTFQRCNPPPPSFPLFMHFLRIPSTTSATNYTDETPRYTAELMHRRSSSASSATSPHSPSPSASAASSRA
jgi:hypothetical protein